MLFFGVFVLLQTNEEASATLDRLREGKIKVISRASSQTCSHFSPRCCSMLCIQGATCCFSFAFQVP